MILITPEIPGTSPGVGTLEKYTLGVMKLTEAIIPAGIEQKLQLMFSGLGLNREGIGRKGDISAVFSIKQDLDDAASVMGNAERKVRLGPYSGKIADGSGIEGQALGDDISPADGRNRCGQRLFRAVDPDSEVSEKIKIFQVCGSSHGKPKFQDVFSLLKIRKGTVRISRST